LHGLKEKEKEMALSEAILLKELDHPNIGL